MPEPKKKVTVWETFDGKEFNKEEEAEEYESKLWEKIEFYFQVINDHWANYEHQRILDECSSIWSRYEGNEVCLLQRKKKV